VLGGTADYNGKGNVLMPWGMSEDKFNDAVKTSFDKAMVQAGLAGTRMNNVKLYGLQGAGDGIYYVKNGTGFLKDARGMPVTLDLNAK
jgi:hypothetical protein